MRFPAALLGKSFRIRIVHLFVAAVCLVLCSSLASDQGRAQALSPDQLQQLIQQRQNGAGGAGALQSLPSQETILQPAAPPVTHLPASRLEKIMSDRAGVQLEQFGYDQLGVGRAVSIPQMGAIQDNYVLGTGDEIVVSLRGQENAEYRADVDRDGRVLLPRLPPISAGGRTFGEFRQDLVAAIRRAYVSTEGYVSIGRLRQVSVLVVGEVGNPGTRIMTALSTPADALLVSGGVKKAGSLRNVKLIRNGRTTTIDLYDLITQHGGGGSTLLADGDRIVVPTLGPTVAVTGWVRHPGIYELPAGASGISARRLMSLAGGLEVRGKYRISVLRIAQNGQADMLPANEGAMLRDSDVLYAQPAAEQTTSQATLSGGTPLAGRYPITAGTKLSDIVKSPGALGTAPYTLIGLISRQDRKTYLRELIAFSPVAVLNGTADMALQTDDIVRVFSVDESQMLRTAIQKFRAHERASAETARNPEASAGSQLDGTYDFDQPAKGEKDSQRAGGAADGDATGVAALKAAQTSAGAETATQAEIETLSNQRLNPVIAGARSEAGTPQNLENEAPSLGRGVATNTEVATFGQVASQLGVPPLVLANYLGDHLVQLTGAVRGPGLYLVGPDVSLADVVQAAGGTFRWADDSDVELTTTQVDPETGQALTRRTSLPLRKGTLANYIVQPQDQFRFRQVFNNADAGSVTVQGQVRFTGTYQISRGDHLSSLLIRAGGLTNVAYPYGTVFLRRSAAAIERTGFKRAADEIDNQLLVAMTRRSNEKLSPEAFAAMQGFVKDLRDTKPLGRMSIIADPSVLLANPSMDLLLEPGDVVYIPQRPSTVTVLGQVLQPGSFPFHAGMSVEDYISLSGGYAQFADRSQTFVILPDGTSRRVDSSWLNFNEPSIPPGSSVVVPRDLSPLDLHQLVLDTTQIMSQLAVSAASLAVLSKQ